VSVAGHEVDVAPADHLPARFFRRLSETAEQGLAGATAFRAPLGFGHASRLHTAKILRLSADLPMVVEMVDSPDRLRAFLNRVGEKLGSGLVTLEPVTVVTVVPTTREGV